MIDLAEVLRQKEKELEKLKAEVEVLREAQRICTGQNVAEVPKMRPGSEPAAEAAQAAGRRFP